MVFLGKCFQRLCTNLPENAYTEVQFQWSCFATLLKSHFGMGCSPVNLSCIFSKHLFLRTPLEGCFWFLFEVASSHRNSKQCRSSRLEVFLRKVVLKIWNKYTGQHPCRSVISIKLLLKSHFGMGVLL